MNKRYGLLGIALSTLGIAAAYAAAFLPGGAPAWAAWLMALGTAGVMASTALLGAARRGRVGGGLVWVFIAMFAIVGGGFALLLVLPAERGTDTPLLLGLPLRAAILLYGVGLLPLFVVPVAYAATFDALTLSDDDLARVRAAAPENLTT